MRAGRRWALGSLLLLLWPSANIHAFDGLPLSTLHEYALVLLLFPVLFSPVAAAALGLALRAARARILATAVFTALVAKSLLLVGGVHGGLPAEYESRLAPPTGLREASYEHPSGRHAATRIDQAIDFAPDAWNLVFLNSARFSPEPGSSDDRERMPLHVRWRAAVDADTAWTLAARYTGTLRITIDDTRLELPPSYAAPGTWSLSLESGRRALTVDYEFTPPSTTPDTPYASVRVCAEAADGDTCAPLPLAPVALAWEIVGWSVDLAIAGLSIPVVIILARLLLRSMRLMAATVAVVALAPILMRFLPDSGDRLAMLGVLLVQAVALWWPGRRRRLVASYLVLAPVVTLTAILWVGVPSRVLLRPAGSDWLTYESQALSILESRSLQGGEPVFYYQPLFRYVRFFEHMVLGDGDALIVATAMLGLFVSALWAIAGAVPGTRSRGAFLTWALTAGLLVAWVSAPDVLGLVRAGASEYPTWIALPVAWRLLLARGAGAQWFGGTALVAAAFITRTNQFFGLASLLTASVLLRPALDARWRRLGLATALLIAGLPLAHNVYYGGQPALLTSSGSHPANLVITPADLVVSLSDAEARQRVGDQLEYLAVTAGTPYLQSVAHGLQLVWLTSLFGLFWRRPYDPGRVLLALVPLLFLAVHLFYQVNVYFPRHVVVAHLAMALVTLSMVSRADRLHGRERRDWSSDGQTSVRK